MKEQMEYQKPMEIEYRSMEIIQAELGETSLPEPELCVLRRVIHTTADFDYAKNLVFSPHAVERALDALRNGAHIVTDTNMALAGINKTSLHHLGGEAHCFMADPDVAAEAKERGVTRAIVSMERAATLAGPVTGRNTGGCLYGACLPAGCALDLCSGKCTYRPGAAGSADRRKADKAEIDHWCSGGICQCGGGQGTDSGPAGSALHCGKRTKGRQQCGGGDL